MKHQKKVHNDVEVMPRSLIQIGDVVVSTHGSLKSCQQMSIKILSSPHVKSYLSGYSKSKLLEGGGYCG